MIKVFSQKQAEDEAGRKEENSVSGDRAMNTTISEETKNDQTVKNLYAAVEQIVLAKQALDHNQRDLLSRINYLNGQLEAAQADIARLNTTLAERESQIKNLAAIVSDKDMIIDQKSEDYQQLQIKMGDQIRDLQKEVAVYQEKYQKLQQRLEKESAQRLAAQNEYEERVIELETEIKQTQAVYEKIRQENTYLLGLVKDFANQMSSSFNDYLTADKAEDEENGG